MSCLLQVAGTDDGRLFEETARCSQWPGKCPIFRACRISCCALQCISSFCSFQSVEATATGLQARFETAVLEQTRLHDLACKGENKLLNLISQRFAFCLTTFGLLGLEPRRHERPNSTKWNSCLKVFLRTELSVRPWL